MTRTKFGTQVGGTLVPYLPDVVQAGDLRREASVHAQELLVEQRSQWQAVESVHAGVIHALRVLNLT